MKFNIKYIAAILYFSLLPSIALAEDSKTSDETVCPHVIQPSILTNDAGNSAVGLGIDYKKSYGTLSSHCGMSQYKSTENKPGDDIEVPINDVFEGGYYHLRGTVSSNSEILPKELIAFDGGYEWAIYPSKSYLNVLQDISFDLQLKHETDQKFSQSITGAGGSLVGQFFRSSNAILSLSIGVDYILSNKDEQRKKIAVGEGDNYWRANGEFDLGYAFDVGKESMVLSWKYLYFEEIGAPQSVKTAGIDNYYLRECVLNFRNHNTFIAYSAGELPFDHSNGRVFKIGWSNNF